ncbi:LysR family transcriptional regulator [Thalassobius vesicularis]|uniref:LysR family transcriptional regulator n=1 Tax=Thalassobius vesicularis TaxID=1294297 RepID=A0A4S3M6Y8_9RHOB|nr:LysR family transcriptional regulator [Thalassobius vesicularis]THD72933.1 LysR family transcriptional regulator [Thalassobius vesicularis]
MNISRTDLNLFVVFEAIYSQGGVTRAAEMLHLTQPTISHALGRLRERVGDPLFVRHGQRLVPTPLAQKMIGPTREALKLFETTLGELDGFDPATASMHFSIGMRSLMENSFFLPLVMLVNSVAPKVTLASAQLDRRRIEGDLSSGELNAAIDVFLPLGADIRREHLISSPSVVVARRGHPLVQGQITLDDYLALDHVIVTSRPRGAGPEDIALSREGKTRQIAARCQQINTAMRAVASSDLVLTMAETFARRANVWFDNQIVPVPFEAPRIDAYLYWHANTDADPANLWLRSTIKSCVAEADWAGPAQTL